MQVQKIRTAEKKRVRGATFGGGNTEVVKQLNKHMVYTVVRKLVVFTAEVIDGTEGLKQNTHYRLQNTEYEC